MTDGTAPVDIEPSMRGHLWLALLGIPALVAGCSENTQPSGDQNDTGHPSDGIIRGIEAEVSDAVPTVVTVRWNTEVPAGGYVEYGVDNSLGQRTPVEDAPSSDHETLLLGLTANTEIYYRVAAILEDEAALSSVRTVTTGLVPNLLPRLTKTGEGHDMYTVVPIIGTPMVVSIIDGEGRYVWYHLDDRELDTFRARLSLDGRSILYNAASVSGDPEDDTELVRVSLDGQEVTTIPLPLLAHDFVELPDGALAAIASEYRETSGETLRGDRIVEVAPDGTQTEVWSSWDCFDPETDRGDNAANAWTLANALDYDPGEDAYYLGMRNLSSIVKIDRATRACLWVLGSTAATFSFASGALPFLHQHQFQVLRDSILVMDNDGPLGHESRIVEYALDFDSAEATEQWTYSADPPVYTFVLGEPTRLDGGDTFVNWSAAGQMERVSPDGVSKWRLNSPMGYAFGFHTLERSLYR